MSQAKEAEAKEREAALAELESSYASRIEVMSSRNEEMEATHSAMIDAHSTELAKLKQDLLDQKMSELGGAADELAKLTAEHAAEVLSLKRMHDSRLLTGTMNRIIRQQLAAGWNKVSRSLGRHLTETCRSAVPRRTNLH